ncbi:CobW family GTP-binding protein [Paenibacillus sp. CAA11]|uniref:CobW family GTP-binding protein n=1 Tax=Paenibacillus sp. CAA11 TaxID=1532905 RepID=UPI00131F1DAD|nr:GTP-binding protein [Paenibacillus sp. CAA11]
MYRIPVVIISGFLGSGKTTLLLRMLQEASSLGLRPGILMNELGKQDVDGVLLEEQTGLPVQKLLDGCVCCGKIEELSGSLSELLNEQPDLILMELTGVANPDEIIKLLNSAPFLHKLQLKHVITVLDAERTLEYNSRFASDKQLIHTLRQQMKSASMVLVNKTDLAPSSTLSKLAALIAKHNPQAEVIYTQHSQLNANLLFEKLPPPSNADSAPRVSSSLSAASTSGQRLTVERRPLSGLEKEPAEASFGGLGTLTLSCSSTSVTREQIEAFLEHCADGLVRAKGYLTIKDHGTELVQHAGGRTNWESSSYPGSSYLVLIGADLDEPRLTEAWNHLYSEA